MSNKLKIENLATKEDINKQVKYNFINEIVDYLLYFLKVFFVVSLAYVLIKDNVFMVIDVDGKSMLPNYQDEEKVYVDKLTPKFSAYQRGDVVIIKLEKEYCHDGLSMADSCYYIKRIVGLPGEKVILEGGEVYIKEESYPDEIKLDESFYLPEENKTYENIISNDERKEYPMLLDDEYFVLGDNRMASTDSRRIGKINVDKIEGKAFYKRADGFLDLPSYNISN